MSMYTEYLSEQAISLSPMDDDYQERLLLIASSFKDFGTALTDFMVEHGYNGNPEDVQEKAKFLRECYKEASIQKFPRDFKKWFSVRMERETAFPLIFALKLDIDGANDFFRRVQLDRSFDCHIAAEAVFYYCVKHGLSYTEANEAINQIEQKISSEKDKKIPKHDILYTHTITEYLDSADSLSSVVSYICENPLDFRYNNATAIKFIQDRWSTISGEGGLAALEGNLIRQKNQLFMKAPKKVKKNKTEAEKEQEEKEKKDLLITADATASQWTVYCQILGLDNYAEELYSKGDRRSLSPVLTNNVLLQLRASKCFPSRQAINDILEGNTGEHERYRKMLILLEFYAYWAKQTTDHNNLYWCASSEDCERCEDLINKYLVDAGYPDLYAGNPYDWIFLWSLHDECPLDAFRFYIGEVFAVNSETVGE